MNYAELMKRATKQGKVVDVTPQWAPWEAEGQYQVGRIQSSAEVDSTMGTGQYKQYVMETDDGLVKFALGAATDKEMETILTPGRVVQITFIGKEKIKGGRTVNKFKVVVISEDLDPDEPSDDDVPPPSKAERAKTEG